MNLFSTGRKNDGGRIKYRIQPGFDSIADYLLNINSTFPNINFIIQNRRNDIRADNIAGFRLVIKSFKGIYWTNRLVYSFFRKSKARRSFETSIRLLNMAFHAPTPVAYVDYYEWGILQSSYFISLYQDHEDLQTSLSRYSTSHDLSKVFANFVFKMHQAGVYHHDFSKGNILYITQGNKIYFSMIDLNRVEFRSIGYYAGLKSLSKLGIEQSDLNNVLMTYTHLWGRSFNDAVRYIKNVQDTRDRIRRIRLLLKRVFFPSRIK